MATSGGKKRDSGVQKLPFDGGSQRVNGRACYAREYQGEKRLYQFLKIHVEVYK